MVGVGIGGITATSGFVAGRKDGLNVKFGEEGLVGRNFSEAARLIVVHLRLRQYMGKEKDVPSVGGRAWSWETREG